MSRESFIRTREMSDEIRAALGEVVVAVTDRAVHIDPGAAVHAIVEKLAAIEQRLANVERAVGDPL